MTTASALATPTFREALRFWTKLGFISFGGPAGQTLCHNLTTKAREVTLNPRQAAFGTGTFANSITQHLI